MSNRVVSRYYERFSKEQRIEHLVFIISFTVLVLTGLPQKYVPALWAENLIALLGGIELVRIVHRIAAVTMIVISGYHVLIVAYKVLVLRIELSMLPGIKDAIDLWQTVLYNLGLRQQPPRYDRYSFGEKLEYWAVVWGTVIMVVTGFMMWNPISTTRWLPGSWIPAAKAAHGGEALLAFISILIWHVYNVHIKHFNRSIFTGKLSREEMLDEHPLELQRLEAGQHSSPDPAAVRRRRRIFLPFAAVISAVLTVGLFYFVTYEQTAITTVPPIPDRTVIFERATPTPVPVISPELALYQTPAPTLGHAITEGRENCLQCHGTGAIKPFSDLHADLQLGNDSCLSCHHVDNNLLHLPSVDLAQVPSFHTDILPVLQRKCTACHGSSSPPDLSSYAGIMAGTQSGPLVTPGDPDHSRVLIVQSMPLEAHPTRLTPEELSVLSAWIQAGAPNN